MELGDLVGIDGSLIQAVLSMYWADYRDGSKKAKVHVGFDINRGIPSKIFLTDGKEGERWLLSLCCHDPLIRPDRRNGPGLSVPKELRSMAN
jgi:hypothetical protein